MFLNLPRNVECQFKYLHNIEDYECLRVKRVRTTQNSKVNESC